MLKDKPYGRQNINMDIVWLGEPECHDPLLTGGKAAVLSRLAADWPVPPGFCLTVPVLSRWRSDQDHAGGSPPDIQDMLKEAYRILGEQCGTPSPRVAVRSSATDEDGHAASFAGQYRTCLNIVGIDSLAEAVGHCQASAFSNRVTAYRNGRESISDSGQIAVLVQQLIPADVSLVAFSVNPITSNNREIVINANWGLGESIVGGTATPDTYIVSKADLAVMKQHIGGKEQMTVPAGTGTHDVPVPRILRGQTSLNDLQIAETARMVLALEQKIGQPIDVECAWKSDRLYLLQCRPITTL